MSKVPEDLRYAETHEWVRLEGDVATVGISDFAQDQLTDVVYVELPKAGAAFDAKQSFGVVESVKSVSDVYAPLAGEVLEVNSALEKTPELVNDAPYEKGWLIKLKVKDPTAAASLLDAAGYRSVIGE